MSLLIFIIALSVIIIAHELGHFWAAKRKGVYVEEFGLGYPPRILGKKIGETIYSLNLLPFGGFVKILGELGGEKVPAKLKKRSLSEKNLKTRISVVLGGVAMNFLLGIVIFSLVYTFLGIPRETDKVRIIGLSENSPATEAGLKAEDWIIALRAGKQETSITNMEQLIGLVEEKAGQPVELLVARQEEDQSLVGEPCSPEAEGKYCYSVSITPRENPPADQGPLGVVISTSETYKPPLWQRPFLGTIEGMKEAYFWGKTVLGHLGKTLTTLSRGERPKGVVGPVGIYQATSEIQKTSGLWAVIHFFGVLSVNLSVINFLPFPALDGSRFWFLLWEGVTKKKPNPRLEMAVNQIGMVVLILLLLLITLGDIARWRNGG